MITAKKKRWGGHWIMRNGEIIGEAWKFARKSGFGMSMGGHFTTIERIYWRNGKPEKWGFMAISAPRLIDLVAIATEYFDLKADQ